MRWFCCIRLELETYWVILQADRIIRQTSLTFRPSKRIHLKIAPLWNCALTKLSPPHTSLCHSLTASVRPVLETLFDVSLAFDKHAQIKGAS